MNILANAIDCFEIANTGKSYDEIAANPNQITIRQFIRSGEDNRDRLYVQIADNGCGMSDDTLKKLFTPFFTTKPVGVGTGLGLSISYAIIESHNGTIVTESELGKGTTFTININKDQN